jgi:hypothetical protein
MEGLTLAEEWGFLGQLKWSDRNGNLTRSRLKDE